MCICVRMHVCVYVITFLAEFQKANMHVYVYAWK